LRRQIGEVFGELDFLPDLWKKSANSSSVAWKMLNVQFNAQSMTWMFFMGRKSRGVAIFK